MPKLFLLSPARLDGVRAGYLLRRGASFELARKFQREGASIAELFAFASGLYFRGKIAYARRFAEASRGDLIRVITTNAGLVDPDRIVSVEDLLGLREGDVHPENPKYRGPLRRHSAALACRKGEPFYAVLLGSIATAKYREVLLECFGERLLFPADFVGRGDMSRGALLLRAAKAARELPYTPIHGAVLKGRRAPSVRSHRWD